MISFVSAFDWDNVKNIKDITFDGKNVQGNQLLEKYKPIEIKNTFGLGKTLFEGYLSQHDETCGIDCSSTIEVKLGEDGVLIDDIIFKTLQEDENWIEQNVRNYQFKYWGNIDDYENQCEVIRQSKNGTDIIECQDIKIDSHEGWINYQLGEEILQGTYTIKLEAEKKPSRTVDWVIKTNGEWLESWATWGNISEGDDAEVTLNSPADNYISTTNKVTFNATANVTGGVILENMTLYNNISGSWIANETITSGNIWKNNLILYYKLDDNLSTTNVIDTNGVNNGTSTTNTDNLYYASGKINSAFDLDGSSENINIGALNITNNFSMSVWVIRDTTGVYDVILGRADVGPEVPILFLYDSTGKIAFGENGANNVQSDLSITDTNWHHVAVTYDGTNVEFYLDNVSDSKTVANTWATGASSVIGRNGVDFFNGKLDEIGIWDRVLSVSEIDELWNSGNGIPYFGITSPTQTFNKIITSSTLWNVQACDSDGDCGFATENRTLTIDSSVPTINIENPTGTLGYSTIGNNETLNITFIDINLESCWYNYNGTNISIDGCLTGVKNSTQFILEEDKFNMTIYANDTLGNKNFEFIEWNYNLLNLNLTYNEEVLDLSLEDFVLYIQATEEITSAKINYGGTDYSSSILSLDSGLYKVSNSFQIPDVNANTNETFYFNITTESGLYITESYNQSVFVLLIDDCSSYANEVFNITLYDEKTLLDLLGTIEVNLELFNNDKTTALSTTQKKFFNMSNMRICSNLNLTGTGYYYDLEMRYYVDPTNTSTFLYVPEFYHIQKASTLNFPQIINLYNLNINQSTEFEMFYRDNDYVARPNVLLQIERKYISEGIYRTVEIPITSSEGTAIGHFDLNNYKYRVITTENGEVLNVFDNPAIVCESELTSTCTLELNGRGSPDPYTNIDEVVGISYSILQDNNTITVDYVIPTGETKSVRVWMIQYNPFQDPVTLCNSSITSSAGLFSCDVDDTIGDSEVIITLIYDGSQRQAKSYFQEDLNIIFQKNNYAIAALFIIFLVTMVVSSPIIMIIASIFSVVVLGFLFLIKGTSIGIILGSVSWLILSGIIILIKINKKDET